MYKSLKVLLAALAAIMVLSLAAGPAAALTRVEVSTTATLQSGRLTFISPLANVICDVTLHATLLRLINKIRLEHVGDITAILTANPRETSGFGTPGCTGLAPMRIGYGNITGTLPNINGGELQVDGGFSIRIEALRCLFRGLIRAIAIENPIRRATVDSARPVSLFRAEGEEFFRRCPARGELSGELRFTPEVTLRLLER